MPGFLSKTSPALCSFFFIGLKALDWKCFPSMLDPWVWTVDLSRGSTRQHSYKYTTDPAYAGLEILNSQIPSLPLAQNFQWETRDTLGKSRLMTALRLYEFNHTTAQTGFPYHTGCVHSLCLSKDSVPVVVQHSKRELGVQRKVCQRLRNRKPLQVVWKMMKRMLAWRACMSLMYIMSAQFKETLSFHFWTNLSISPPFSLLDSV